MIRDLFLNSQTPTENKINSVPKNKINHSNLYHILKSENDFQPPVAVNNKIKKPIEEKKPVKDVSSNFLKYNTKKEPENYDYEKVNDFEENESDKEFEEIEKIKKEIPEIKRRLPPPLKPEMNEIDLDNVFGVSISKYLKTKSINNEEKPVDKLGKIVRILQDITIHDYFSKCLELRDLVTDKDSKEILKSILKIIVFLYSKTNPKNQEFISSKLEKISTKQKPDRENSKLTMNIIFWGIIHKITGEKLVKPMKPLSDYINSIIKSLTSYDTESKVTVIYNFLNLFESEQNILKMIFMSLIQNNNIDNAKEIIKSLLEYAISQNLEATEDIKLAFEEVRVNIEEELIVDLTLI